MVKPLRAPGPPGGTFSGIISPEKTATALFVRPHETKAADIRTVRRGNPIPSHTRNKGLDAVPM
jgi:hypothetical protein